MSAVPEERMTGHRCFRCNNYLATTAEMKGELRQYVRTINKHPGTLMAKSAKARALELKERLAEQRRWHAKHLEEFADDLGRPRRVKDVRRPKPQRSKPKAAKAVRIDRRALEAAKAEMDALAAVGTPPPDPRGSTLPAIGCCHECERPVSGERRFCGRCMAQRKT